MDYAELRCPLPLDHLGTPPLPGHSASRILTSGFARLFPRAYVSSTLRIVQKSSERSRLST